MRRHSWALAALLLLTVLLGANSKLVNGHAAPLWDANDRFAPYFTLIADHARAGRILLWEPWTSGGTPPSAEPEFGSFSLSQLLWVPSRELRNRFQSLLAADLALGPLGIC